MATQKNKDVELPRIKRNINSRSGKVIHYLLTHDSDKAATELTMEANNSYWLVEALSGLVGQEELNKACWWAIDSLVAKLIKIMRIGGIERLPTSYQLLLGTDVVSSPISTTKSDNALATNNSSQQQLNQDGDYSENNNDAKNEDDDDWNMNIQATPEMIAADLALQQKG
jgi:hypothetical protein